jgi:hypothetical protein
MVIYKFELKVSLVDPLQNYVWHPTFHAPSKITSITIRWFDWFLVF